MGEHCSGGQSFYTFIGNITVEISKDAVAVIPFLGLQWQTRVAKQVGGPQANLVHDKSADD